jgi:hypothetical protein
MNPDSACNSNYLVADIDLLIAHLALALDG